MNAKMIIGAQKAIEPVGSTPNSALVRKPSCHTSVTTPQVANTDSRFIAIAFSGRTTERNARARSTNVISEIRPSMIGNEPYTSSTQSMKSAVGPPTPTPGRPAAASRTAPTASRPSVEFVSVVVTTSITDRPSLVHSGLWGALAACTPSASASAAAVRSAFSAGAVTSIGVSGEAPIPDRSRAWSPAFGPPEPPSEAGPVALGPLGAAQPPPVGARPDRCQHDREHREGHGDRDQRDQQPPVGHRLQERDRQHDRRQQADRDGGAAEHNSAPRGRD